VKAGGSNHKMENWILRGSSRAKSSIEIPDIRKTDFGRKLFRRIQCKISLE